VIRLWIFQLQIIVKFLLFQFLNGLNIQVHEHGVEVEERLDLLLVRHGVYGEVEVVEGEELPEIRVLLKDEIHAVQGEDGLEDAEVLGEEQEALDVQSPRPNCVKLGVLLRGLFVNANVVVVNVRQTAFHIRLVQHHRLLDLWGGGVSLWRVAVAGLRHGNHELLVIVLENFPLLLLFTLEQRPSYHLLLDFSDTFLGVEVLCHYKIIMGL
jgi:hypothetical protein